MRFACLDKYGFVLKHADDKETLQSSKQSHARLRGTTDLSWRKAPSCLTFSYRVTGDSLNRLIVSINDQAVWSSRLLPGHRLDESPAWSLSLTLISVFYLISWTAIQLNISSSTAISPSRQPTSMTIDGEITSDGQIELENLSIVHQPCPSGKSRCRRWTNVFIECIHLVPKRRFVRKTPEGNVVFSFSLFS
jgi:hypothetical protein